MKEDSAYSKAAEILESPMFDFDVKYVLARFVERSLHLKDASVYEKVLELTKNVNTLLEAMKSRKIGSERSRPLRRVLRELELREGQHVIFFTSTLDEARALAKEIAVQIREGHIVYDADSDNGTWLKSNIRCEIDSKSISILVRAGTMSDETFAHSPEESIDFIEQYIREKVYKEGHSYVLGISLTTTETLIDMATEDWEQFMQTAERLGTDRIHNLPSNWVCFYSLSELQKAEHIRRFLGTFVDGILAHDIPVMQDETGSILVGRDAILKCFELILEKKVDELLSIKSEPE